MAAGASVAVVVLVLPGVSGSFLLLVMGLYEPTLAAVDDLDVAYIAGALRGVWPHRRGHESAMMFSFNVEP